MAAFIGNLEMVKAYVGGTPLTKIFAGDLLIWPTSSSTYPTGQLSPEPYGPYTPPTPPDFGTGLNADAYIITNAPDGGYYLGGAFTSYDGTTSNRIIKILANGDIDTNFNIGTGFDAIVRNIVIGEFTGNLHVTGSFNTYKGTTSRKVITLNPTTGAIVRTYNYASTSGAGYDAVELSSTNLLVAGTNFGWGGLRMFNMSTGQQDTTNFSFSVGGTTGQIWAVERFDNGVILCGGSTPAYSYNYIFAINSNGSSNTSVSANVQTHGFSNQVSLLKKYNGTTIIGAGYVNTGVNAGGARALKIYDDGTWDATFKANVSGVITNTTFGLDIKNDVIALIGPYSTAREYPYSANGDVILLDMQGNKLYQSSQVEGSGFQNSGVFAPDGNVIFVQNTNTTTNWVASPSNGIYYWAPATGGPSGPTGYVAPMDFSQGIQGTVYSIETYGQKLLVGGDIQSYNGTTVTSNLIRLSPDGSLDETFFPPNITGPVRKILHVPSSNTVLVGGEFSGYFEALNGVNGSLNSDWSSITFDGVVRAMHLNIYTNEIAIAGDFTGGLKIVTDRGAYKAGFSVGTGTNSGSRVNDVWYSQSKQRIYLLGNFTSFNGETAKGMAAITMGGTADNVFSTGVTGFGATGEPYCMFPDNYFSAFYVGGSFSSYKGNAAGNFAKIYMNNGDSDWDPAYPDEAWTRANQFNGPVHSIQYINNRVNASTYNAFYYVGGQFTSYLTGYTGYNLTVVNNNNIGLLPPEIYSEAPAFSVGAGANAPVYAIKAQYAETIPTGPAQNRNNAFVGGAFTQVSGSSHNRIVQIGVSGSILPL